MASAWVKTSSARNRKVAAIDKSFGSGIVASPPEQALDVPNDARKAGFPFYLTTHYPDNIEVLQTATDACGFPEERRGDLRRWRLRASFGFVHAAEQTLSILLSSGTTAREKTLRNQAAGNRLGLVRKLERSGWNASPASNLH
jgi:hypothetical protein